MEFKHFSLNGKLENIREAVVPLSSIEYAYGFGVYETVRIAGGVFRFLDEHIARLFESARIIELEHGFTAEEVRDSAIELVKKNRIETCNIKILLVGAPTKGGAQLYMLCLNPRFPDKKLYCEGASFITYEFERPFPRAKTLSMLQSYLAFRKARERGAYDALLLDSRGSITEGTRANFFTITGGIITSPPEDAILPGITRSAVLALASQNGFDIQERPITWSDIRRADGAFITSTSAKIMPVRSIDDEPLKEIPAALFDLMKLFDDFLGEEGEVLDA
jgi:branched-subunit amino acid aminotransferase/4-amino-4-deoxychorismate lyase